MMHPVFLLCSFFGSVSYYVYLKKQESKHAVFRIMLPVFLFSAIFNPLFHHEGITLLLYLPNGNPLTLESILYGLASGMMLVSVLNWFFCYQSSQTSDRFLYLFGRAIPALSLILSMVLRFVPRFQSQLEKISDSQKCIGRDVSRGSVLCRARHGIKILSVMTTWALENSVDTADSMKSRGYGLRGRTNFSIYRFDSRDLFFTILMLFMVLTVLFGISTKHVFCRYYPMLAMNKADTGAILIYLCYGALCLLPAAFNLAEDLKWHYLTSKI